MYRDLFYVMPHGHFIGVSVPWAEEENMHSAAREYSRQYRNNVIWWQIITGLIVMIVS